jgi:hypothetical protein
VSFPDHQLPVGGCCYQCSEGMSLAARCYP